MDPTPKPANHPSAADFAAQLAAQIKGKTVLITGASPQSLANTFLLSIVAHGPKELILAGRSASKLQETAAGIAKVSTTIKTRTLIIDLESLDSTRQAATEVNSWSDVPVIDVLVLSAGIMAVEYGVTKDGFERQFGVNHLAQFLFANLILPKVLAAPEGGRVVSISSSGHGLSPLLASKDEINFNNGKTYNRWVAYGQGKTSNSLFATALASKLGSRGLQAYTLHPGAIGLTGLGGHVSAEQWGDCARVAGESRKKLGSEYAERSTNHLINPHASITFKSLEDGAATYVVAAFNPTLKEWNGGFLQDGKLDRNAVTPWATDAHEADRLWALSEEFVGQRFAF